MNTPLTTQGIAALPHRGLIRARGADAVKFLQGQLTNDVMRLGRSDSLLAGFCSAKGRLQASFLIWKLAEDDLLLACAASVLPATLKRLGMFVMRAQCKLTDAAPDLTLMGAVGDSAREWMGDTAVNASRLVAGGSLVRLADVDGLPRCLLALETAALPPSSLPEAAWRLLEVRSGIALIEAETVDRFVPQMLNYELIDGVDFRKGCYPGQEVVARSQYRGTIKRRMYRFACGEMATPGDEVFHDADPSQPAGMVVNVARSETGAEMLVEVKLAALEGGRLHLGSVSGPLLVPLPLPYPIPTESVTLA